jgi:hypothetical protein
MKFCRDLSKDANFVSAVTKSTTKVTLNVKPSKLNEVNMPLVNPSQLEELSSQISDVIAQERYGICRKMLFVGKFVV